MKTWVVAFVAGLLALAAVVLLVLDLVLPKPDYSKASWCFPDAPRTHSMASECEDFAAVNPQLQTKKFGLLFADRCFQVAEDVSDCDAAVAAAELRPELHFYDQGASNFVPFLEPSSNKRGVCSYSFARPGAPWEDETVLGPLGGGGSFNWVNRRGNTTVADGNDAALIRAQIALGLAASQSHGSSGSACTTTYTVADIGLVTPLNQTAMGFTCPRSGLGVDGDTGVKPKQAILVPSGTHVGFQTSLTGPVAVVPGPCTPAMNTVGACALIENSITQVPTSSGFYVRKDLAGVWGFEVLPTIPDFLLKDGNGAPTPLAVERARKVALWTQPTTPGYYFERVSENQGW